jgi:AraC family transcriptional regulator
MTAALHLKSGQFLGDSCRTARAAGFSFAEIAHTSSVHVPSHTHDDAHFVLVLSGDYSTRARAVGPERGSCALIFNPPGTTHRDTFRSRTGRFFTISVLPEHLARLSEVSGCVDHPVALGPGAAATLATRMFREFRNIDALSGFVLEGLSLELLGHMARDVRDAGRGRPPAWFKRALELLRETDDAGLTVRDVAAQVGVHPYHLTRVTRAFAGRSPGELIRDARIQRSQEMLASGTDSIGRIALACGYTDQSQFTRSFRRATGTTPAAFRRERLSPNALLK